ncbi:hypothetical protein [Gordonibacter urolithinfaciens]|uniref:hypothetical protein n=1 Tax=Gordonibacter urolithinfaciens TaxID=1335613 RepID=UPI003AAB57D9
MTIFRPSTSSLPRLSNASSAVSSGPTAASKSDTPKGDPSQYGLSRARVTISNVLRAWRVLTAPPAYPSGITLSPSSRKNRTMIS